MQKLGDYFLRPMREDDLAQVFEWRNSRRIRTFMCTDHEITWREHHDWFKKNCESAQLNIFANSKQSLGVMNITDINKPNGTAMWGFYLGRPNLPRGMGMVMGWLGLRFAFEKLKLRKLSGEVLNFNEASLKLHRRLGFKKEGLLRQHVLKKSVPRDVVLMALLKKDWHEKSDVLLKKVLKYVKID